MGFNLNGFIPDDLEQARLRGDRLGTARRVAPVHGAGGESYAVIHASARGRLDDVDVAAHYTAYFVTYFSRMRRFPAEFVCR
jgi:hypothetical protein